MYICACVCMYICIYPACGVGLIIHQTYHLRVVKGVLKEGEFPASKGRGAQGWEPLSPCITIPTKQVKRNKMKIACLNVQGCNDPAKRECVGRMFEERGLDVLVVSETKLKGRGERMFGNVVGRVSGVSNGRAREGVGIIVRDEWKRCVIEWKEVSSRLMYVRMNVGVSKYVIVGAYGPGSEKKKEERECFWFDLGELVGSFESDEIVCVCVC